MVHSTKSRLFAFVLAAALVCSALCGCARLDYDRADRLAQSGDYAAAAAAFDALGDYRDAARKAGICHYRSGVLFFRDGDFDAASRAFSHLSGDMADYGPLYFATLEEARPKIAEMALSGAAHIEMMIGDLPEQTQSYDQQRGLVHLAQCELAAYSFDGQRLVIDPVVYPGVRIVAAWKNGTLAALSAEDAALYEEAQAIVDAAKAASDGDPLALESYLYNYVSLAAVYDGSANEPVWNERTALDERMTARGALLSGRANCQGFSDAFYLLASLSGFDVRYCFGRADGESHVWNAINLGGQWYWVDLTFDNNVENFVEGANTHVFLNFTASRDASRTLWPNSECVSVASSVPSQYDYDAANGTLFFDGSDAADYALYCRNAGIDLVDFAVAGVSIDSADLSAALERTTNARGIACSWYCASYPADDRVGFVVRWE